jgi:hypothetical protein
MFIPLLAGFGAFLVALVLIGWFVDPDRQAAPPRRR